MKRVSGMKSLLLIMSMVCLAAFAKAQEAEQSSATPAPKEVVENVTNALLSFAKEKSDLLASDPDAYFAEVKDILNSSVDFLGVAKNVMGKRHWFAASEEQRETFVRNFADSLVRTYGKGMANFTDFEIAVESSQAAESSADTNYVVQSVKTNDGVSKVVYTMKLIDGRWQLRNVVLNGVNMGKSFHSQFAQLVKDSGGDVGQAVEKWGKEQV